MNESADETEVPPVTKESAVSQVTNNLEVPADVNEAAVQLVTNEDEESVAGRNLGNDAVSEEEKGSPRADQDKSTNCTLDITTLPDHAKDQLNEARAIKKKILNNQAQSHEIIQVIILFYFIDMF